MANSGNCGGTDAQLRFVNNATTQAYFDNIGDLNLRQDMRWPDNLSPILRCLGGLRVHLNEDGTSVPNRTFDVVIGPASTPLFAVDPVGGRVRPYLQIEMSGSSAADRKVTTSAGDLEVSAIADLNVICNTKNTASGSVVNFCYSSTLLFTLSETKATFNIKVDANAQGIRTATGIGAPSGGESGDIKVDTLNNRLYVKVGANWRYATLA